MKSVKLLSYAWKLLWNDKKIFWSIVSALTFILVFITIAVGILHQYVDQAKLAAYQTYGDHTLIVNSDEPMTGENALRETGHFRISGNIYTFGLLNNDQDLDFTIGWMDEHALTQMNLLRGRMPESDYEVLVEEFTIKHLAKGSKQTDIKLPFTFNIEGEAFTVVGIVKNYSGIWSSSTIIDKGKNTFPNIILTRDFTQPFPDIQQHMILIKDRKESLTLDFDTIDTFFKHNNLQELDYDAIVINTNLYDDHLKQVNQVYVLTTLFLSVITITALIVFTYIFSFYYSIRFRSHFNLFSNLGFTPWHIYKLAFFQGLIIVSISAFFMFLIHIMSVYIFNILPKLNMLLLMTITLIAILLMGCLILIVCHLTYSTSRDNIRHLPVFIELWIKNWHVKWKLFYLNLFHSLKSFFLIIGLLTSLLVLIFLSELIANETLYETDEKMADYIFSSKRSDAFVHLQQFEIFFTPEYIPSHLVDEIENEAAVAFMDKEPKTLGTSLLLKDDSLNAPIINRFHEDVEDSGVVFTEQDLLELDMPLDYVPLSNIHYVVLNDNNWSLFNSQLKFSERTYHKLQDSLSMILIIPDETIRFDQPDTLSIGRIENLNNELEYKQWDLQVLESVKKTIVHPITKEAFSNIIIMIHENTMQKYDIFPGYGNLEIYREAQANINEIKQLENKLATLAAMYPDNLYYIEEAFIEKSKDQARFISRLGILLFSILGLFVGTIIFIVFLMKFYQRERELLIYKSLGGTTQDIIKIFLTELLVYYILSLFLATGLITLLLIITPAPVQSIIDAIYLDIRLFIILGISTAGLCFVMMKKLNMSHLYSIQNKYGS